MKDFSLRGIAILFAAIFALCTSLPIFAEEEEMEEITVTGSFIKRDSFDSPVPLDVIDRAQLEDLGAVGVEEVIQNLTYTAAESGIRPGLFGGWTGGGGINLRGLGNTQTLTLFNGRRVQTGGGPGAQVNISTMVPQIAIERMEIVKDGAGALYGSDAVAGVANFITRNDFEGLEIMLFGQVDGETHSQKNSEIAGIWGASFDQGRFMMSMSYVDRTPLQHFDRPDIPGARITGSDQGSTGMGMGKNYVPYDTSQLTTPAGYWGYGAAVPYSYNEFGQTTGVPDLDCGIMGTITKPWSYPHLCGYDYAPFYPIEEDQQKFLYFTNVDWDWSDNTTIHLEMSYMNTEAYRHQSGWPFNTQPVIPSYNPGAVEDARRREALCVAQTGAACGIVPIDLSYNGRFGVGVGGVVGGVKPLEVRDTQKMRLVLSADGEVPFADGWTWDVAYTFGELRGIWYNHDAIKDDVQDALNGLGGAFCDENNPVNQSYAERGMIAPGSTCVFWNPFFNAYVKDDGSVQDDPLLVNTNDTIQTFQGQTRTTGHTQAIFIDAVVTGDLVELPNGLPVGMAIGAQYREEWEEWLRADNMKNFGFLFVEGDIERNIERDMYALFGELSIPVLENLEVQLALRYEDFGLQDSTDPKIAVLYSPLEDLNVRASYGTSFKMPNLAQTVGSDLALANIADGGRGSYYIVTQTYGDASLKPESADVWNIGLSWKPTNVDWLEGFSMDLDWFSVDHTDKIVAENNQDLIDQENNTGVMDPRIIRDPVSGKITRLVKSRINSDTREVEGFDLVLGYSREVDNYGSFSIRSAISWYEKYQMTTTDRITGLTQTTKGVGWANFGGSPLQILPEYKINTTLAWNYDRHRVVATLRYVPEFEQDGNGQNEIAVALGQATKDLGASRIAFGTFTNLDPSCPMTPSRANPCTIDDFLTVDLQYTYRLPEIGFQQEGSQVQLGIINATNQSPPGVNDDPGWIEGLHDPRGRLFYLRYSMNLF